MSGGSSHKSRGFAQAQNPSQQARACLADHFRAPRRGVLERRLTYQAKSGVDVNLPRSSIGREMVTRYILFDGLSFGGLEQHR